MSVAEGLHRALERGAEVGCGAVQIFLKNQRRWAAPGLSAEAVRAFSRARAATGIRHVFAHASYLINLAAPGRPEGARAVDALTDELERAEALRLSCVVVHPGSHLGAGVEAGLARASAALDEVARRTSGFRARIALENSAGGGRAIGRTFDELGALIARSGSPERLGVCVDTCHLFAAGYDIRRPAGYRRMLDACRRAVGVRRVLAFHLNDAAAPLGSGLDRHEHIGRGRLGLTPFRLLLGDQKLGHIPKVIETPKEPAPAADARNLAVLRGLRMPGGRPAPRRDPRRPAAISERS